MLNNLNLTHNQQSNDSHLNQCQTMQNPPTPSNNILNKEQQSSTLPIMFKAKQIEQQHSFITRSAIRKASLNKQIRTIPTIKSHYRKKGSVICTFDKMVQLKTGLKFLRETSQEETNSRAFFSKFIVYEMINAAISLLSIAVCVIHYEGTYNPEGNDDIYPYTILLIVLNILSLLLWINNFLYYYDQYKLKILNKIFLKDEMFIKTMLFKRYLIEIVCTFIQPCFLFCGMKYSIKPTFKEGITLNRSINAILSLFVFTRMYYIGRYLVYQSSFMTPENNEICRKHYFNANIKYALIGLMRTKPLHIYLMFVVGILFVFQYAIKIFESGVSEHMDSIPLNNSFNVIWYCIITIFTIGYGDIVARTDGGRIFAIILSLTGSFLVSLFLMGLTNYLIQTPIEKKQFNLLNRIELNEAKFAAADLVGKEFSKLIKKKANIKEGIKNQQSATRVFVDKVKDYSEKRIDVEHHGDLVNYYPFNNVDFTFRYFEKEYGRMYEEDQKIIDVMDDIYAELDKYKNKLKTEQSEKANKGSSDFQAQSVDMSIRDD